MYIKMIVDEERFKSLKNNTKIKSLFWLTDSQQFKVLKEVSESLAGRVGVLNLYSLSNSEINCSDNKLFSPKLEELKKSIIKECEPKEIFNRIYNGGMPSVVTGTVERNNYFSSYINTYIERDVKQLLNVGKTIEFYNFM